MELLARYDPARLRGLDYRRLARMDPSAVLERATVVVDRSAARGDANQPIVAGPLAFPPGTYEARVWLADQRPRDGRFEVVAFERATFGTATAESHAPVTIRFVLPVAARRLMVAASDARLAAAAVKVEVVPLDVVPASERDETPVRTVESIGDAPGAYIVYLNEHAYPEGGVFWTRGVGEAAVLVAPGEASRVVLTLFAGPQNGSVRVVANGREQLVPMRAGETSELIIETAGRRLVPVTVQSPTFFRPADVDPASTDTRGLGCQVRISVR
jgi:hypothetical protein